MEIWALANQEILSLTNLKNTYSYHVNPNLPILSPIIQWEELQDNRAHLLGALYFKFLCTVDFTAKLTNYNRVSVNFVSLAVFHSDLVWGYYFCLNFYITNKINGSKNIKAPSGEVGMGFWFVKAQRGALTLESGMGMCRGHEPFFSGQLALVSLPIYRQCAAHLPPHFQFFNFFFCIFRVVLATI